MIPVPFYSIVVNGSESYTRDSFNKALLKAGKLRRQHGPYNVWIRPHVKLVSPRA